MVFLCDTDLPCCKNILKYNNNDKCQELATVNLSKESRFSMMVEEILAFASSANLVTEGTNLSPNFKRIA